MKIALVNSRKPRLFQPDEPWLVWTMALGHAIARAGHTLVASSGTIGYDTALWSAAFGAGNVEVFVPSHHAASVYASMPHCAVPNLVHLHEVTGGTARIEWERDCAVVEAADVVIAVAIRAGGQMESLLLQRLRAGKTLQVVEPAQDEPMWHGSKNLLNQGARRIDETIWQLARATIASRVSALHDKLEWDSFYPLWRDAPLAQPTLAHFTRAAEGPWPGQTHAEYLEDLWFGGARARRDAEATLRRILRMQRLIASPRLIRGRFPVVSFTAISPARIHEMHRYRSHLVRWDFEPWGIVFDREWLAERQAYPVKYLPSAQYAHLAAHEKPWFQKHEPPACDFSAEKEWRVRGDVDFSDAPRDAVRLVLGA